MRLKRLCCKYPVWFSTLLSLGLLLLGALPLGRVLPSLWAAWLPMLLRAGLCLLLIRWLGLWHTAGFHAQGYARGLMYGLPFYAIGLGSAALSLLGAGGALAFLSWRRFGLFAVSMLLVGANEELWLRALLLNFLQTRQPGKWRPLLTSAVLFGAIHFVNLFSMPPVNVLLQAVNAFAAGLLFGAIFLRCRNFWAVMTVHALVDFLGLFVGECFANAATVLNAQLSPISAAVTLLGGVGIPVLSAVWLMKKQNTSACHLPVDKV